MTARLTTAHVDRAAGVLLGMACGDALGAGYEFGPPLPASQVVVMAGGGGFDWAAGEWTDDTSMALAIAEVSATGLDLRTALAQDQIAARWYEWGRTATDVGVQTRQVLTSAGRAARAGGRAAPSAVDLRVAAAAVHAQTGKSGGNGSLMRTAPVALAYLDDPAGLVQAATEISALTHDDPEAAEACVLWCLAIRHAVLTGTLDGLQQALTELPDERAGVWAERLDEAERKEPADFDHNGWVVQALQGAWSAITRAESDGRQGDSASGGGDARRSEAESSAEPATALQRGLEGAVRGGRDTDTVAAIAGALLGARWGASAVPAQWRRLLHGWPGLRARDLVRLGVLTARSGHSDPQGWPAVARMDYRGWDLHRALVQHPLDDGVWLSGITGFRQHPPGVDAVVSLCRLGVEDLPGPAVGTGDHVEVWLVDDPDPNKNPHLDFVLLDAARAVATFRTEGRTVLLHCVQAQSRTPTVAAIYGALVTGRTPLECLTDVRRALPGAQPNPAMLAALRRLESATRSARS